MNLGKENENVLYYTFNFFMFEIFQNKMGK